MIWIEILSRHHDVVARHRIDADEARIGRAYDNDVVVDDPLVAAHHLLVFRADDGALIAEDLGSANGLFDARGVRVKHAALDGAHPVRIGRTLVRVRDASFAVPPERRASPPTRNGRKALLLAFGVAALSLLELWFAQTGEPRLSNWLGPMIVYAALLAAWATGWALLSRLFGGAARFSTHLAIALAGALVWHLFDWATDVGAYSFAWRVAGEYAYVGLWTIAGIVVFAHLVAIAPRHSVAKAAIVTSTVAAAVVVHTLFQVESQRQLGERAQMATLLPPQLRLRGVQEVGAFFGSVDAMKPTLDRAREEEPATTGWLGDLFDE